MEKGKDFIMYSLAVDESCSMSNTAYLPTLVHWVDLSMSVTEELLGLKSVYSMTAETL